MMRKYILIAFIAILGIGISGCLLTGQVTFVESIDIGATTDDDVSMFWLDLNVNDDYSDNIDKLKSIDAISIVAKLINNNPDDSVSAEIYVDSDTSYDYSIPDTVEDHARRIFWSPKIPPNDTLVIEWNDSFLFMENIPYLENLVRNGGAFAVYGLADRTPFDIWIEAEIVITMTFGP